MNILVLAPHLNDEKLNCGGTIKKHINYSDDVSICFANNRTLSLFKELLLFSKSKTFVVYNSVNFLTNYDKPVYL